MIEGGGGRRAGPSPLRAGAVTSMGSLPHHDAAEAAVFVLRRHPQLPAAPQLPGRSPLEGMVAQGARGIPGVTVAPDGRLAVGPEGLDPSVPVRTPIDRVSHGGLFAFLRAAAGRTAPVKVQLAGPVTLGLALVDAGVAPADAFAVAGTAVADHARELVALVRRSLPGSSVLAVLDEPGLIRLSVGGVPLTADGTIDLLSGALAALESAGATTGVHCCGLTDWRLVSHAGPTLLALPAEAAVVLGGAGALAAHLERGGWIAWGAVPTDQPVGADADRLWRQLSALWGDLVRLGCDPALLRTQSLVTPACGLAGHGVSQAGLWLDLASELAGRVSDQAMATRLSIGA